MFIGELTSGFYMYFFERIKFSPALCLARFFCLLLFLGALPASAVSRDAVGESGVKKILVVDSHTSAHAWSGDFISAFEKGLAESSVPASITVVEFGVLRMPSISPMDGAMEQVREKVAADKPDLIVIMGLPAIEFLEAQYTLDFKDTPLMFAGYPDFLEFDSEKFPHTVAVTESSGVLSNVSLGMRLFPETGEIAIITDAGPRGVAVERHAKKQLESFGAAKLKFISGSEYGTDEMMRMLGEMGKNSFVVFDGWRSAAPEIFLTQSSLLGMMREHFSGPIFSDELLMSDAVFGGMSASGSDAGAEAAKIAAEILKTGAMPENKIYATPVSPVFNWKAVDLYGVPRSELPEGAMFFGRPPSVWSQHKLSIVVLAFAFVILAGVSIFLVVRNRILLRNNILLKKLPLRIAVFDADGKVVFRRMGDAESAIREISDMPEGMKKIFRDSVAQVLSTGKDATVEYEVSSTKRKAILSKLPSDAFGENLVLTASMDVTDLFEARARERDTAEHLRITMESIGDGLIATDGAGRITMFNGEAENLTGRSRADAIGKALEEVYKTEDSESDRVLVSADGERRFISENVSDVSYSGADRPGKVVVFRDISEERRKRDEILAQNTFLTNAAELSKIIYFTCNDDFSLKQKSGMPSFGMEFWAKRGGEYVSPEEWIVDEDRAAFLAQWHEFMEGKSDVIDSAYRSEYGGKRRHFRMVVQRKKTSVGPEYLGIIQDITDSKETELKLRDRSELLSKMMENLPCSLWIKDTSDGGRYVMANLIYREALGMESDDLVGKTDYDIHPEEFARKYVADDLRVAESGAPEVLDEIAVYKGERINAHTIKVPLESDGEKLVLGMSFDVTDLVQARERMKAYAEQERIVNECLKLAISSDSRDGMANGILEIMGKRLGAARCCVFEFSTDFGIGGVYEWSAPGVPSRKGDLKNVAGADISEWANSLRQRKTIVTDRLAQDASPEFIQMRRLYESKGLDCSQIKSLMATGIWSAGKLWGFILVDFTNGGHKFMTAEERMLESAAGIFELYMDRQRGIENLEQSEAEKSMILESIQIPVLLFDNGGLLVTANRAAGKMFAKKTDEMGGLRWRDLCARDPECAGTVARCIKSEEPQSSEITVNEREYVVHASPIFGMDGEASNVIVSAIDMTEFNEGRRMLLKAIDAAKAADRAKSYFLATMSHELRTPLNSVIGYSELAQDPGMNTGDRVENIKNINYSAKVLLNLINDILDLSKLEAGQLDLVPVPVDMRALMDELEHVFGFAVKKQGISLGVSFAPGMPNMFMLDLMRLKQVLLNIVGNAVKFTEKGGIKVGLSFKPDSSGKSGQLSISVADTGSGISPDYLARIFEPFKQHPGAVRGNHVYEGTGLGLPISQRLADRMGGRIEVKSEKGRGSVFTLVLEHVRLAGQEALPAPAGQPAAVSGGSVSGTVMIVDDVPMNLKVLGAVLKKLGLESVPCGSAQEALEKLEGFRPDAIFTDLWMPEMSGADLAKKIRENPDTSDIPIVVITADSQMDGLDRSLFKDVVLKPITIDKMKAAIQHLGKGTSNYA